MYPLKSPSPDGMPPLFFQHFWPTIGNTVTKTILDFLNFGFAPPKFNDTHVVLIPKNNDHKNISDYRPISLCNMICKLASKVIANRLKKILHSIISDTQSAFVHGRLINDNILVAFEVMCHISQKKAGKRGTMALKLDMSKAYDCVEWVCLGKIMEKLGFNLSWRRLIMRCVTTISYSFKINGKVYGSIQPTKGIHQGDPLSPYLYLMVVEGLSSLIKKSVEDGTLEEVAVCRGGPKLSHLFFADDSLIFYKATISECESLQRIFQVYENAFGQ